MKYQKLPPPFHLKDHVRYFWILEHDATEAGPKTFITIADGFPGIIFHDSANGPAMQDNTALPPFYLYGQTTRYGSIHAPAGFRTIGVYFYPHALKSIFGLDAHEVTGGCVDLGLFSQRERLLERLLQEQATVARVDMIAAFITKLIAENKYRADPALHFAAAELIRTKGTTELPELRRQLHITERTFERRFQQHIGMSPKLFTRIRRFQATLDQLRNQSFGKLSDIAFEQAYADQSHFIRTFKEFAGHTPNRFYKSAREVVENFPELLL